MNPFIFLQSIVPQHLISRIIGGIAKSENPWIKNVLIKMFIRCYAVNMSEAEVPAAEGYRSFNHFFARKLKPNQRIILGNITSPCDGQVSQAGQIKSGRLLQVKGIDYQISSLLGGETLGNYTNGSFITIYLAPKDYHRVHAPIDCEIIQSRYVPGSLFSVNQVTTNHVEGLFTRNERLICEFKTRYGMVSLVLVGAMLVAGIKTVWRDATYAPHTYLEEKSFGKSIFKQGEEIGYFELGSTVILTAEDHIDWSLSPGDLVKLGQPLVSLSDNHRQS